VALLQQALQSIQGPVRQRRGDDSPLRCTFRGGEPNVLLQEARLQPLPEQPSVQGDVLQQPGMADAIEARGDIPFQDPAGAARSAQQDVTLLQGVRTAAFSPEAV